MKLRSASFLLIAGGLLATALALQVVLGAPAPKPPHLAQPLTHEVSAEGRVVGKAGSDITVGAEISGAVEELSVIINQPVRRGDVIARIHGEELRAAVREAEARLREAESDARLADQEKIRAGELARAQVGTLQNLDRATRDADLARARRASAVASLAKLRASLDKTVIRSPIDGIVTDRAVDPGETVDIGDAIATIVDPRHLRIDAEVDEFDVARVVPGAAVRISADGFDRQWRGRVEEIPMRVVGRSIRPADPAQPVDTRVLLVGVEFLEPTPLKIGQRVQVEIGR